MPASPPFPPPKPPPIYRTSAQLQIERMAPRLVDITDVLSNEEDRERLTVTQLRIMQSRAFTPAVAARVIGWWQRRDREEDDLTRQSLLQTRWLAREVEAHVLGQQDQAWMMTLPASDIGQEEQVRRLIRPLLRRLKVERVPKSRLLSISLESSDPSLIAKIVTSWVEAYMDLLIQRKVTVAKRAREWLQTRVNEERKRSELAERALQVFREQENILSSEGEEQTLVKKIIALTDLSLQARVRRLESEAQAQLFHRLAKDSKQVFDSTIRTQDELMNEIGLPALGEVIQFQRPQNSPGEGELIVHRQPHSPIAEAFRHVRTNLILHHSKRSCKAWMQLSWSSGPAGRRGHSYVERSQH